jgi:hypothetical protein
MVQVPYLPVNHRSVMLYGVAAHGEGRAEAVQLGSGRERGGSVTGISKERPCPQWCGIETPHWRLARGAGLLRQPREPEQRAIEAGRALVVAALVGLGLDRIHESGVPAVLRHDRTHHAVVTFIPPKLPPNLGITVFVAGLIFDRRSGILQVTDTHRFVLP